MQNTHMALVLVVLGGVLLLLPALVMLFLVRQTLHRDEYWSDPDFVDGFPHAAPEVGVVTVCSYTTGARYPNAECRRCRL